MPQLTTLFTNRRRTPGARLNLLHSFSILSLISIVVVCIASSYMLARFLKEHILNHYAQVTHEFVQSVADIESGEAIAAGRVPTIADDQMAEFLRHLAGLPDTLRTNIYGTDPRVVWSSDAALIGKRFAENHELDKALAGALIVETGVTGKAQHPKVEHMFLSDRPVPFVEIYMPIRNSVTRELLGVAEIYRIPSGLFATIETGTQLIWLVGAGSGLFLYLTLFWIVRRAHHTIREQQDRLIESETLAAVGEMGSAVAHGIRNPLASIRSSAELLQEEPAAATREAATDIVSEADKIEKWVRDLLSYSQPEPSDPERVALRPLIERVLERYAREMQRRRIATRLELPDSLPCIAGDEVLFEQVFANLVTNAMEAMPDGGSLTIDCRPLAKARAVKVTITDTGVGMKAAERSKAFVPFHTTKPKGLGLGLALVRRIVRRFGGQVSIESAPGRGTAVTLELAQHA